MHVINELNPRPDDLVVVPENMDVPEGVPFHVYKMKFLHCPSIIRSGSYSMGMLNNFSLSALGQFLGFKPDEKRESVKDVVFDVTQNGPKLRDSEMPSTTMTDESGIVHFMDSEPPEGMLVINPDLYQRHVAWLEPSGPTGVAETRPVDVKSTDLPKFYRYVRPTQVIKHENGEKVAVSPRGGVGFYIELDAANKTFAFSYALCHNKDNFDYGRSRLITKGRFESDDWYEVKNYDEKLGVVENISIAVTNFLYNQNADETKDIVFSSTPDGKVSYIELKELLQRI